MRWVVDYNLIAIIVIVIVLSVYFIRERFQNRASRLFVALAVDILLASIFDSITMYTNSYPDTISLELNYLLNVLYFLFFNAIAVLIYVYVVTWVKEGNISNFNRTISISLAIIQVLIIIPTPITHLAFYFEDSIYHHGELIPFLFSIVGFLLGMTLLTSIIYRHRIDRLKRYAVYIFVVMATISLLVQYFYPAIILTNFLASLFVLVIYMTLQDPESFLDKKTECLNKKAFFRKMRETFIIKEEGCVVFLDFEGFTYINRMIGVEASNEMLVKIADFLRNAFGGRNTYHMESGRFSIIFKTKEEARKAAERISFYYNQEEMFKEVQLSWIPKMCIVSYPEMATSLEGIMEITAYFYDEKLNANTSIVIADETTLSGKKRKNLVIQAVNRAIQKKSFEVYFQPIMDAKDEKVISAEALVRLIDEELGFVSPDEFILAAEENGCILDIDRIVLEKVCIFLQQNDLKQYGIDYVEVNLSVVELMQENLTKDIFHTMDRYGVGHDQISFEVTETAYMNMDSIFFKNLNKIVENNSSVSMDDYGTGFSNSWNLTKFPYRLVKVDKSILWEAIISKTARVVLENSVKILKKIKREIVVEGVETKEQVALLQKLDVDKLQGYYYSRPLPLPEFMEFLERSRKGGSSQ